MGFVSFVYELVLVRYLCSFVFFSSSFTFLRKMNSETVSRDIFYSANSMYFVLGILYVFKCCMNLEICILNG